MPNPYRNRGGNFDWSGGAFYRNKEFAALVAECIAVFARAEVNMARIFASALLIDEQLALDIYIGLRADSARNATFDAVLVRKLTKRQYTNLSALRAELKTFASRRNSFCHDVWATDDTLTDAMVVIDSMDAVRWFWTVETEEKRTGYPPGQVHTYAETEQYRANLTALNSRLHTFARELREARQNQGNADTGPETPPSDDPLRCREQETP